MTLRKITLLACAAGTLSLAVAILPALVPAQRHAAPAPAVSPYVGLEQRAIKALSPDQVRDLLQGAGMGLALAGELNRHPGPRHVLDLAGELALTDAQREATEAVFAAMRQRASELGGTVVAREHDLDRAFAQGTIDAAALERLTTEIGQLQGALRNVHLRAHLEMKRILTPEQVRAYDRLRGYDAPGAAGHSAGGHGGHGGHAR